MGIIISLRIFQEEVRAQDVITALTSNTIGSLATFLKKETFYSLVVKATSDWFALKND